MAHALQIVDEAEETHEVYVEASPVSVGLYQKFGFLQRDRIDISVRGEPYYNIVMIRPSR
jgi:hypothetical protein